jgi:predicted DNA-binding protein (MmcQ/YjbR family)
MNIEGIRKICKNLPDVTEGIKWGADLCFMINEKMFCVTSLEGPLSASFKVTDEEFGSMSARTGIIPAPYVARYKWVMVQDPKALTAKEWEFFVTQSYNLVKAGAPKKKTSKKKTLKKTAPKKKSSKR